MTPAGLDKHPGHDSEAARELWRQLWLSPHNESVEKLSKNDLFSRKDKNHYRRTRRSSPL